MISAMDLETYRIAVLIPCFNEELTIRKVITDFQIELPTSIIYVFDNNSTDQSRTLAEKAGAIIVKEKRQGKGFVIASMLAKIVADIYVMVDGDDTYPADRVHDLIDLVASEQADMAVGQRLTNYAQSAFRPLHVNGNKLVCSLINAIFNSKLKDPMSGYRAFSRAVALDLPVVATGFDTETEMTLQLLYRHYVIKEIEIEYRERPEGSQSKLNTFRDGAKVLYKIFSIVQSYKPLTFYGGFALLLAAFGLAIGSIVIKEYILYQYIYSVPKAILATGLMLVAVISLAIGIILHSLNFRLLEISSNAFKTSKLVDLLRMRSEK